MRQTSSSALAEIDQSEGEFGTGLRARLALVRTRERSKPTYLGSILELRQASRRDLSPELALVSPDFSLGELMLDVEVVRDAPLGTLLAEAGLLQSAELDFALACAREHGKRLGEVLVEQGLVAPAEIVRVVAAQRGLPFVDVRRIPVDPAAAKLLPAALAKRAGRCPSASSAACRWWLLQTRPTRTRCTARARCFTASASSPRRSTRSSSWRASISACASRVTQSRPFRDGVPRSSIERRRRMGDP